MGPDANVCCIIVDDLGGVSAGLDDDAPRDDYGCDKHELRLPPDRMAIVLSRKIERAEKGRSGRCRDTHKDMWAVADTFGDILDSIQLPFPTHDCRGDGGIDADIAEALEHQAGIAEHMKQQQDSEDVAATPATSTTQPLVRFFLQKKLHCCCCRAQRPPCLPKARWHWREPWPALQR